MKSGFKKSPLKKKQKNERFGEFKGETILRCKILEKVLNDVKKMALLSENHHRIEVRVAKIKEMKEK